MMTMHFLYNEDDGTWFWTMSVMHVLQRAQGMVVCVVVKKPGICIHVDNMLFELKCIGCGLLRRESRTDNF